MHGTMAVRRDDILEIERAALAARETREGVPWRT